MQENTEVSRAIEALKAGKLIVAIDDASKHISGYLVLAAEKVLSRDICFMVNFGRGVISAAITEERLADLGLHMMTPAKANSAPDFFVSVDARNNVTTGISASDRAATLQALATTAHPKLDLVMPGHIFPLRANNGGVLVNSGIAEASTDLLKLANLVPVAAICHCLNKDGDFASYEELLELADVNDLRTVGISDIIKHKLATENIIEKIADTRIPLKQHGTFRAVVFRSKSDDSEHLALIKGDIGELASDGTSRAVLVRVQAEHRIGDLLGIDNANTRDSIHSALSTISEAGCGVLVYIRHPKKGVLQAQVEALARKSAFTPTKSRELRETGIGFQILSALGIRRIKLLTNSSQELAGIKAFSVEIVDRLPLKPQESISQEKVC
ncbi:MAG: 3,4-dihydroxy-2-butanone-4-phosphate synthase [Deltaproteobacteria bacterium]|nr:3,4-dihydroxy-2-butanone-4-phosphate synthase [Deltaproteobacteria bacterium]